MEPLIPGVGFFGPRYPAQIIISLIWRPVVVGFHQAAFVERVARELRHGVDGFLQLRHVCRFHKDHLSGGRCRAESPEEIAVSIVSELISRRNGNGAHALGHFAVGGNVADDRRAARFAARQNNYELMH